MSRSHRPLKDLAGQVLRQEKLFVQLSKKLAQKIDKLEQYSRRNNVRILGIPESKNEDLADKVKDVFENLMNLKINWHDVDHVHRVGKQEGDRNRAVVVKFLRYDDKNLVFKSKKLLKNSGVAILEDLTQVRLNLMKRLLENFNKRNVWTSNGRICVKTSDGVKIVENENDLKNLRI